MSALDDRDNEIVEAVRKKYGDVIDIAKNPRALIEILQRFGAVLTNDGGTPGGAPVPPPPPNPCAAFDLGPNLDDVMRELLQLRRDMADLGARMPRSPSL